eukprot:s1957_g6.t1
MVARGQGSTELWERRDVSPTSRPLDFQLDLTRDFMWKKVHFLQAFCAQRHCKKMLPHLLGVNGSRITWLHDSRLQQSLDDITLGAPGSLLSQTDDPQDVVDLRQFDTEYQEAGRGLVTPAKVDVPGGLGYLVKQWPVDEYARFYNDDRYRDWMLKEGVYLNDIYFFIQQGLVTLHPRSDVEHIGEKRYRVRGEEVEFDEVLNCDEAKHKTLSMPFCPNYSYTDHIFGIWSRKHPNLYFLGTTWPYTGAFGCIAEVNAMFVHRMITESSFHSQMMGQFPGLMHSQRVSHYVQATEPDKMHVHWAGMHCLWLSRILGCDISFSEAFKRGMVLEWMTGPINALRCLQGLLPEDWDKLHVLEHDLSRTWGDRLVVASYFMCLLLQFGFRWRRLAEIEQTLCILATAFLVCVPTPLAQLRGYLMMLAFDSLYHRRAWVMLFCNILQFLFAAFCFLQGTDFGIPLEIRAGCATDSIFLLLGYFSFPRAFFADMRPRSTYKAWLFDTYLPMVLTKGAEKKVWSRKAEGRFPEAKELKQRVRDVLAPSKDLGHSDAKPPAAKKAKTDSPAPAQG